MKGFLWKLLFGNYKSNYKKRYNKYKNQNKIEKILNICQTVKLR